jgi:23S rRNA pseudoU1915 N3-methylase RlmH
MGEGKETYKSFVERDIEVTKESQGALEKWDQPAVSMDSTGPSVGYEHQVIVTIENDPILLKNGERLVAKYPHNTTIVHMDEYGNYEVAYGLKLDEISKGDLKITINGHGGYLDGIDDRSVKDIAKYIGTINQAIGDDSEIRKVSLVPCSLGSEYPKRLLSELQKQGVNKTLVSTRLGDVIVQPNGRKTVQQSTEGSSIKYRSSILKETYALDEKGDIVLVDSYTDEHYDLVLSANEDGTPKIERIYGNKLIDELQGGLKIHVKAADFNEAKELLHQFEEKLPPDASMEHINIKTQKDDDWFDQHDALKLGKSLDNLGEYFDASILLYPDPDKGQVTMATRDKDSTMMILKDDSRFLIESDFSKNILRLTEYENPRQRIWGYGSDDFDSDIQVIIEHRRIEDIPTIEATLENLKSISEITQQSVSNIVIEAPKGIDLNHYKELVVALSNKYKVEVEVSMKLEDGSTKRLLSKKPGKLIKHLAQATPYQNKLLQNWDILSQEQTTKLTEESQKTKPRLANHDHQVLIQTESDENVKNSTLKLASKHPTQTTIVQMQKDGTYRVVYGSDLKDVTGSVKMVVVGYGREEGDTQTMGGRTADELSANITKLNQALTGNADIQRISIVGCNMESDNPTDNSDSQYGRRMVEKLNQSNIKAPVAVRSSYVAVDENGKKLTSNTGSGNWMHKDSAAKTIYSLGATGAVISRVYNDEGTLIKYNGKRLNQDLDNDTNPQDTGNQQTESDRQEQSRVNAETEVTKQKLNDIDKQQTKFANSVNPKESTPLRNPNTTSTPSNNKSKIATTAFNIQINIGNGDHTTFFGGSTNVDVKVGNGGHYALMYGDNNIFVSIGDADNTDRFVAIGDYRALEGVQVLIGTKSVVVNHGISHT